LFCGLWSGKALLRGVRPPHRNRVRAFIKKTLEGASEKVFGV